MKWNKINSQIHIWEYYWLNASCELLKTKEYEIEILVWMPKKYYTGKWSTIMQNTCLNAKLLHIYN